MLTRLRRRSTDEGGFTLIELLVVILIIGILAAIAIPSFLNQQNKANDANAKELARTSETAAETYATDHDGAYTGMTAATLNTIEPTIAITSSAGNGTWLSNVVVNDASSYTVTTTSTDGNTFSITRNDNGTVVRDCTTPTGGNAGGCPAGTW